MQVLVPSRVTRRYTQRLVAPPERVFPLLCPVREAEWARGWDPRVVYTVSGMAEPGCVFVTGTPEEEAAWVVTRYELDRRVGFVKVRPGETVGVIEITLVPRPAVGTDAEVAYTYTALGAQGEAFLAEFTEEHYVAFMQAWEAELGTVS